MDSTLSQVQGRLPEAIGPGVDDDAVIARGNRDIRQRRRAKLSRGTDGSRSQVDGSKKHARTGAAGGHRQRRVAIHDVPRDQDADPERDDRHRRHRHLAAVRARDPLEPAEHARRVGEDRLVVKVVLDVPAELARSLVAARAILLQGLERDRLHVAAQHSLDRAGPRRHLLAYDPGRLVQRDTLYVVRQPVTQQLVQEHAEAVHVAAGVQRVRVRLALFGAHVLKRPDHLPHVRLHRGQREVRVGGAGHAEVDDLRLAVGAHENVPGLEIAMDDAELVAVIHGIADPGEQCQPLPNVQVLVIGILDQRAGVGDVLHREIRHRVARDRRVLVHPRLVDLGDVGVPQAGQSLDLVLEAPQRRLRRHPHPHHLQSHGAVRVLLDRLVHDAHPAHRDDPADVVVADASALHDGGLARPGQRRRRVAGGLAHERAGRLVRRHQRQHLGPESRVRTTLAVYERQALLQRQLDRREEDLLNPVACGIGHRRFPPASQPDTPTGPTRRPPTPPVTEGSTGQGSGYSCDETRSNT